MAVIIDTNFIVSLLNPGEESHVACRETARQITTTLIVPATVLPEVAYLVNSRLGHFMMRRAMAELMRPTWTLETLNKADLERSVELLDQYADARLDFVDVTLIAIAERLNITTLLTLDHRDFSIVRPRHCQAFDLQPFRP